MLKALTHHLKVLFFGTREYEKEWADRENNCIHRGDWNESDPDWVKGYWDSINHPHRNHLIKEIALLKPSAILEIGCNCGPNLRLLGNVCPQCRLLGIDINPESVEKGNIWLRSEGQKNVNLIVGKADNLSQFPDNSFDIVFTDAVLIYIGPDKIQSVIQEITRVAKKEVILFEWNYPVSGIFNPLSIRNYVFRRGLWAWNYMALLKNSHKVAHISCQKIPPELWSDRYWQQFGSLIRAELHATKSPVDNQ